MKIKNDYSVKNKIKELFCLHLWDEGFGFAWYEKGCPIPFKLGLNFGEGYYKPYHCAKCGKIITSTRTPISYIEN